MKMIKKQYIKNIIAGVVVACMAITDGSLALVAKDAGSDDLSVQYESHELDTYLADGDYKGSDSYYEKISDADDTVDSYETLYHFNILEIVRGEGMGTIGYFIDGLEPITDGSSEDKHAYMEALTNADIICGRDPGDNISQKIRGLNTQLDDTGRKSAFKITKEKCTGYYKYVGKNNGLYFKYPHTTPSGHYAEMVSKFSTSYSGDNDYIWVDTTSSMTAAQLESSGTVNTAGGDIIVDNHYRFKYTNNEVFLNSIYTPEPSVAEWKKNHKINLRTRICDGPERNKDILLTTDDIRWADLIIVSSGNDVATQAAYEAYKAAHPEKNYLPDRGALPVLEFKNFEQVLAIYDQVVAKEETAIVFSVKDIITSGKIDTNLKKLVAMLFYIYKQGEYNSTGKNYGSGRDMFMDYLKYYVDKGKAPSQAIDGTSNRMVGHISKPNGYMYQDFPRKKVSEGTSGSYKVDMYYGEDGTVVVERYSDGNIIYYDDNGKNYDQNGNRIDKDHGNPRHIPGYFVSPPVYTNDTGVPDKNMRTPPVPSNTTDYIYIDEATGNFMVDMTYSGSYYWVDHDVSQGDFAHRYVSWNKLYEWNNSKEWPWFRGDDNQNDPNKEGQNYLTHWWFSTKVTDQGVHTPLYYQYFGWGDYRVRVNDILSADTQYKNSSFAYESDIYKGNLVKQAIAGRENRREYTDETHAEQKGTPHYYFLSVNIENGDGVNKTMGGNKVLYINDYEINNTEHPITEIPIKFTVRTSENISRIDLYKKGSATPIQSFTPLTGENMNDITAPDASQKFSGSYSLELVNKTEYDPTESADGIKKPAKDAGHHDLYVYKFCDYTEKTVDGKKETDVNMSIKLDDIKSGRNNRFVLRVTVPYPYVVESNKKYVEDEIIIVRRDFFALD